MINPRIFRQYDIRGLVDTELTPAAVEQIGKAYGTYLQRKIGGKKVSIARDCRSSSDSLRDALSAGIVATGIDVVDIGVVTTPLLYFSLHHLDVDGGVMITGSHNPPEFNGLKVAIGKATIHGDEIQELRRVVDSDQFIEGSGTVSEADVITPYRQLIRSKVKPARSLKVVVDSGNGTTGPTAPMILRDLGCEVIELFTEMDGTFPNHHPDPVVAENLQDVIAAVRKEGADLGIAYDGDGDRIGAIDDEGNIIWGDQLLILYARDILKKGPAKIIFEVKCSQALVDEIEKHGGVPIMWKTGHSFIKDKIKQENAVLAGEMSGHMFFADDYFGYDDATYASARLVDIVSRSDVPLSQMLADIPKYYSTPEIRVDCPDDTKFEVVEKLKDRFKADYDLIDIDGVRVLFDDGWGLVRASNTQPVLVLRFESRTQTGLERIKDIFSEKLSEFVEVEF